MARFNRLLWINLLASPALADQQPGATTTEDPTARTADKQPILADTHGTLDLAAEHGTRVLADEHGTLALSDENAAQVLADEHSAKVLADEHGTLVLDMASTSHVTEPE